MAELDPVERAEVVRRYRAGEDSTVIASDFGVTPAVILRWARKEGVEVRGRDVDFTDAELRHAAEAFVADVGRWTWAGYAEWVADKKGLPSCATMRSRAFDPTPLMPDREWIDSLGPVSLLARPGGARAAARRHRQVAVLWALHNGVLMDEIADWVGYDVSGVSRAWSRHGTHSLSWRSAPPRGARPARRPGPPGRRLRERTPEEARADIDALLARARRIAEEFLPGEVVEGVNPH